MGGAAKRRAKNERQANLGSRNNGGSGEQNVRYDGPSERPGSSAGPGQASSSRGRAPSNAPNQPGPSAPAGSTRTSSRPPSAAGPALSSRPQSSRGPPLRDPALDPSRHTENKLNPRIEWGGNAFNYYSDDAVRGEESGIGKSFPPDSYSRISPPSLVNSALFNGLWTFFKSFILFSTY